MKPNSYFLVLHCCSLAFGEKYFAGLVEGDIAVREDAKSHDGKPQSAFLWHQSKKWEYGVVPYYIDEDSIMNEDHRDLIKSVIGDIEAVAKCITFQDISGKEKIGDHLRIRAHGDSKNAGVGCWSYPGKQGGEQVVNLGAECMDEGMIAHELLHALGQLHEQTRPDRDNHVEIVLKNIEIGKAHNFEKREKGSGANQVEILDASYDMYSLLHYPSSAWSKDKKSETIIPVNKQYKNIGGSNWMTATDIIELNLRYNCSSIGTPLVVDYIHEVERRGNIEIKNVAETLQGIKEELKILQGKDKYDPDEMATSACVGMSVGHSKTGTVVAVRRQCSHPTMDCATVCLQAQSFPNNAANKWTCFDSLHVYKHRPNLDTEDIGKYGPVIHRYGSCSRRFCGPNYCCCIGRP